MEDKVYILDTFSKYENNSGVKRIFQIHLNWYCIREVSLSWGTPITPHFDDEYLHYTLYNTLEEANAAANRIIRAAR